MSTTSSNLSIIGQAKFTAASNEGVARLGEKLRNGIWPSSLPLWMATFYVGLFIIRPWEQLFPWMESIRFEKSYALLMIIVVALSSKKQFRVTFQSVTVLLVLWALGISGLFAWQSSLSWKPFYEYMTLVIIYFVIVSVIRTPYELLFMLTSYITTMFLYLAKSEWEFFVHDQHRYDMGVSRLIGIENTFGGPNALAMSIVVSLPLLLFLWSIRKEISHGWPKFWQNWFPRMLVVYFFLAVTSIILTNSRSGMLGCILFVLLSTFNGKGVAKKMGYIAIGVLFLAGTWILMPDENKNRFRTIWDPTAGPPNATMSATGRKVGFRAGIEMFKRFPITGVGIGNFTDYRAMHVDGQAMQAHNLVGQVLGETGLVGSLPFLLMILVTLSNCRRLKVLARSRSDPTLEPFSRLGPTFRNAIILLLFEGLFGHNLLRFNWLWLAAFAELSVRFVVQRLQELTLIRK